MLPSKPKIFHGRESELDKLLKTLEQESPRIAILGAGGIGKTSLARAVLHHENTSARFHHRFFISAESAVTSTELAGLVGLHIGLEPAADSTKPVVNYFARQPRSLLILDNLETPWEPLQARRGVEEFLSLLADITNLALVITMRGSERPGQVPWSHPFLQPLQPLSDVAARQIFVDITDDVRDSEELNKLLRFTDNLPLAVDLVAHLVDYEGLLSVLTRWETERTSLLAAGYNRESNLDISIATSISGPRLTPEAKQLLGLLSILPDGLSDVELVQANLPIPDIRSCKSILLATSLAYSNTKGRLCSLTPIREYMQKFSPPSSFLTKPLCNYFHSL
ncbi:P-loop containing nucleoside triphosphate hydrolase protein, partial [Mycena metata]